MNRGNCRMDVFQKPGDFAAFATILEEGRQRVKMRILAYCSMNNHAPLSLPKGESLCPRVLGGKTLFTPPLL